MKTRQDILGPYGRAWAKVLEAIRVKVSSLNEEELLELIAACREGRWARDIDADSYASSFEVERLARQQLNTLRARKKAT